MPGKNTRVRLISRGGKKVLAHRWIMEQHLGRKLLPTEQVHHINENPLDNRLENLVVMDGKAHQKMHKQIYPDTKTCVQCGATYTPNPRKRKRQQTCGPKCARALATAKMAKTRYGRHE